MELSPSSRIFFLNAAPAVTGVLPAGVKPSMDHLVQQRLTQCLRVLLEVLERELDQRRLVRDAPGEVRETRIVRDPVRGNLAAEALVVELREEELELGDVGKHAFEALYAPARTSLLVTRGAGSGLPPRIYLPIDAVLEGCVRPRSRLGGPARSYGRP